MSLTPDGGNKDCQKGEKARGEGETRWTHSDHLLGRLDRKTVGLDGGTGAGGLGLLVLALDLRVLASRRHRIEACPIVVSS